MYEVKTSEFDRSFILDCGGIQFRRKLSNKQQRALELLLQGKTQTEVASELEIDPSTVWRWLRLGTAFEDQYRQARAEIWSSMRWRLRQLGSKALDVLETSLSSEDERIRLKAAIEITRAVELGAPEPPAIEINDFFKGDTINVKRERERYFEPEYYLPEETDFAGLGDDENHKYIEKEWEELFDGVKEPLY